jgi:iron uptake system component EfeO
MATLEIPPAAVALGASELIEEVSQGKITGEEDRYSKTDLWDFAANVEGSQEVIELLTPALEQADPDLLASIQAGFEELDASLAPLRKGDGWVLFCQPNDEYPSPLCPRPTVTREQIDTMKAQLAALSEDLSQVPGALGLS